MSTAFEKRVQKAISRAARAKPGSLAEAFWQAKWAIEDHVRINREEASSQRRVLEKEYAQEYERVCNAMRTQNKF